MSAYKIGRGSQNDIVIIDSTKTVSTEHAVLENVKGQYFLTDLSVNGTSVNGKKIPKGMRFPVSSKDKILFAGQYEFDWNRIKKNSKVVKYKFPNKGMKLVALVTVLFLSVIGLYKISPDMSGFNFMSYDATELYQKYNKSIVLIYNKFYYTINIDGSPAVYIGLDSNREYSYSLEPSDIDPIAIEGTGFFISKSGQIITNRHVAYPWTSNSNDQEFMVTNPKLYEVYKEIMKGVNYALNERNIGHLDRELSGKTVYLGVALNNSFVNSEDDFIECVQIKHHEDHEIDLALMQTMDQQLASSATYLDIENVMSKENIDVGDMATIIGFPGGSNYQTSVGSSTELQAISNVGSISQKPSEKKVMYQAPTTHGASGAPVFNEKGELIAVNFSGYKTQGFNYGILVKYINDLIE